MREELKGPEVKDVGVAIIRELNEDQETIYNVYLVNLNNQELEGCLVAARGYGENATTGETVKTSTLRHFLDRVPESGSAKIEPIMEDLFGLNNEYWVSFWLDGVMYDKKYIFLADSIREEYFVEIPIIHKKGVFIK